MNRVRLAFCMLVICGLSVAASAQEERATPVVTAAAPVEKIRFAGAPSTVQLRIEVRSAGGAFVYDSDWKDGNLLDWLPLDSSFQPLAFGAYRLVMKSKNLAGQTSQKEVALHVEPGGMAVEGEPSASPKITLTAHDGETGQLITTSGDLSFRFGDFLNREDTEAMRLTPAGELNVKGLIRASGIMFPDGTILTTGGTTATAGAGNSVDLMRRRQSAPNRGTGVRPPVLLLNPPSISASRAIPRPNFAPAFQFVVGNAGVSVGTTNPAYRLDVTGVVNTGTEYDIGATRFVHNFGTQNTFLGAGAGNFTMTGNTNTATGYQALVSNTTGSGNTATGTWALSVNTAGCCNTASGASALNTNTTGGNNVAIGYNALVGNITGNNNTAIGANALYYGYSSGLSSDNTAIGSAALLGTLGSNNIAIGRAAGQLGIGSNNIDIGNRGGADDQSTIRIGDVQTKTFIAGIRGVTTGAADAIAVLIDSNGQLGTVSSSRRYKFDINSMGEATDGLMGLRPVTFRYLSQGENAPLQYGLIAEEVAEVYPEMITRNKDGEVDTVMYQFLAPMLLNEVQKQHRQIEEQQKTIDAMNTTLERLIQRVEQLEGKHAASR